MKKTILAFSLLSSIFLFGGEVPAQSITTPVTNAGAIQKNIMDISLQSMSLVQKLTKNYLYKNNGVRSSSLDTKIEENMGELSQIILILNNSVCKNVKVQQSLKIIAVAESNLQTIVLEKYSLENMQLLLDLGTVISEASAEIIEAVGGGAEIYKKDSNTRMPRLSVL